MTATASPHTAGRLTHEGAVDADGHILEPTDLWESYLEPKYRDRALRFRTDERGLEELEIGGRRSLMSRNGFPSTLGAMGAPDLAAIARDPEATYDAMAPYGSQDPAERLRLLDAEGIDAAVLYTTVGLLWEAELDDPELSQAYCRAYNRWITDFCSDGEGRLVPAAHVSLSDPVAAAAEAERAVAAGARSVFVCPFTHDRKPLGHPDHDPVFAACQDLDVVFAIHPTFEPTSMKGDRMGTWDQVKQLRLLASVQASDGVRHQWTTLLDHAVYDKFPRLKVLILESGGGWIGYWLDRLDAVHSHTPLGNHMRLQEPPSHYFRTRTWISCDPDERMVPALAERYGADRFLWASDFPHADHTPDYVNDLQELADLFTDETARRRVLGDNARELFGISPDARRRDPSAV